MTFKLSQIFLIGTSYLLILFLIAYLSSKHRMVRHPAIYVLSLGIYASAYAIYGSIGFAYTSGYNFLTYFLGISGVFLLSPILLVPILKLCRMYQLSSLADLFAFRYRNQSAGSLATLVMLVGVIPLLTMQIQAISDTAALLTQSDQLHPYNQPQSFALVFVLAIVLFAILFGARSVNTREKHEGLVMAMAFGTLIKIICFSTIAFFGVFKMFGSFEGLDLWLNEHPQALEMLYKPLEDGPWRGLLLAFFAGAVVMPHMYHMIFTENLDPKALLAASWAIPLMMLILAICVPLILWSSMEANANSPPEYFSLGLAIALDKPWLAVLAFCAGLSAASGIMIVATLSLATMVLNHIVLPIYQPSANKNLYTWLLNIKRLLILLIPLCGYGFYWMTRPQQDLSQLVMLAYVATLQFVPGLMGVLFWQKATHKGFIAGLLSGFILWIFGMLLPLLATVEKLGLHVFDLGFSPSIDNWQAPTYISLMMNAIVFVVVSRYSHQSAAEKSAAGACAINDLRRPYRWELTVNTINEFIEQLTVALGKETAKREVQLALNDLTMGYQEQRPYALRRLRDQIEANLSGLMGPTIAREMVDQYLPFKHSANELGWEDTQFIESRLETGQHKFSGLSEELDNLRRFHRQTLHILPVGVCSVTANREVISWNLAMEKLTEVTHQSMIGSSLTSLPNVWHELLSEFLDSKKNAFSRTLHINEKPISLKLHKVRMQLDKRYNKTDDANNGGHRHGFLLVLEDVSDMHLLQAQLAHSERLASIGRFAAGVAHEIGNPVTGIACLAQEIEAESDDLEAQNSAREILNQTQRISRIVSSLVNFSRMGPTEKFAFKTFNLKNCVAESVQLIKLNQESKNIVIYTSIAEEIEVWGDEGRVAQVFTNLLSNACDAYANPDNYHVEQPRISIEAIVLSANKVQITITDFGEGISQSIKDNLVEPFVTTKDPGKGTGLGLAVVYSIIEDHNGQISFQSPTRTGVQGTEVTFTLSTQR